MLFQLIKGIAIILVPFSSIGIFYPAGEPISPQMLRCGPFAVGLPQLHDPHLASTATSTRKSSSLPEFLLITSFILLHLVFVCALVYNE